MNQAIMKYAVITASKSDENYRQIIMDYTVINNCFKI